jgi:hypothetical protein
VGRKESGFPVFLEAVAAGERGRRPGGAAVPALQQGPLETDAGKLHTREPK